MKFFFLEFVYCCGYPYRPAVSTATETSPSPAEKTLSLSISCTPDERRHRSRKPGRLAASRSGSAADWRPSLNAISEDKVPAEREARATVGSERDLKRKVAPTSRDRHRYHHSDDYRRAPFPAIIPAFSPTPFLF